MTKKRKSADFGTIVCSDCGSEVPKRGPSQRYCRDCSQTHDIKRKGLYQLEKGRQKFNEKRAAWAANGEEISRAERRSMVDTAPVMPNLIWYTKVAVPFSWSGSKNNLFTSTRSGHTFLRDEARYYRTLLTGAIRDAVTAGNVVQNKLWIDIYVQKPNHKGDATNFLDMVCDAVKDAIPLDDRWYSVRWIDWQICKSDPMLYVGVGQDTNINVQACSACGRLLEFHEFQKNRAATNGIARVCRECQSVKSARKRREKARPQLQGVFA